MSQLLAEIADISNQIIDNVNNNQQIDLFIAKRYLFRIYLLPGVNGLQYTISNFYKEKKITLNDIRSLVFSCQPNLRVVGLHGLAKTKNIATWLPAFFDDKNKVNYQAGCLVYSKTIGDVAKQIYDEIDG